MDLGLDVTERNGYAVLQAASGAEALIVAGDHACDLLLTDVIMPSMSGPELTECIRRQRPRLAVLFMSGYSHGVLGPGGVIDRRMALIEKPFNARQLLEKVHSVITGDQ